MSLLRGDMAAISVSDGRADAVTGGYALRNAPDLAEALIEVRRVLKPGGRAGFLEFRKPPSGGGVRLRLLALWGSLWGLLLHRNPEVYRYIALSLASFPDQVELEQRLRELGFVAVRSRPLLFGFVAITTCTAPDE